jgi:hypothetical protein
VNIANDCAPVAVFSATAGTNPLAYTFSGNANTGANFILNIRQASTNIANSGIVSNTTAHAYTYTFGSVGTYTATRTVAIPPISANDGGCADVYTRTLNVQPSTCSATARTSILYN